MKGEGRKKQERERGGKGTDIRERPRGKESRPRMSVQGSIHVILELCSK